MATGTPFVGVKLDVACGSNFRQSFCNRDSSVFGVAEHLGLWLASVFVPVIQRENFFCERKPSCVSYPVRGLEANVIWRTIAAENSFGIRTCSVVIALVLLVMAMVMG